jgi:hypothetical protein
MRLILFIGQLIVVKFVSLCLRKLAYVFVSITFYAFSGQSCQLMFR